MKILAIDGSGKVASVAVTEDDNLVGEYTINYKTTHSQTLLPMIEALTKLIELDLKTLDAIAVSAGPGSFTGLRIGSATAKGLGLALNKPIVAVPSIDSMAMNLWGSNDYICPLVDCRRKQVYTGIYQFVEGKLTIIRPQCCELISDVVGQVNDLGGKVIFLGDGAEVYKDYLKENLTCAYDFAPAHSNKQRAASVAVLGAQLYAEGKFESAADHKPEYLRLAQAEAESQGKARDFTI